jgi:hypothetical protein
MMLSCQIIIFFLNNRHSHSLSLNILNGTDCNSPFGGFGRRGGWGWEGGGGFEDYIFE